MIGGWGSHKTPNRSLLPENWLNFINLGVQENPQEEVEILPQSTINSCFFFKASHAQELMESKATQPIRVEVIKVIQLSAQQFQDFSANLLRDMPFITAHKGLTGYDKGVTHCLLVTTRRNRDGILVNSEGYSYARYAAYVRNIGGLKLDQVPVEQYRKPRARPER